MRHRCPNCHCEFDGTRVISRIRPEKGFATVEGKAIFEAFVHLTGAEFKVIPTEVKAQACKAGRDGFTCEDLDLAIAYTRWGMANDCGFNSQSLTWGKLFGDAITGFRILQDRLDAARRAKRERGFIHKPQFKANTLIPTPQKPSRQAQLPPGKQDAAQAEQIRAAALSFDPTKLGHSQP
jgi:hypothetical protein